MNNQVKKNGYTNSGSEKTLAERAGDFVERPGAYAEFNRRVNERVLGQPDLKKITYSVFMWMQSIAKGRQYKQNIIISAPTGCGKTETFRAIRDILGELIGNIPVLQFDSTTLTPEGFKGKNMEDFLEPVFEAKTDGRAIVVLDEFDKLLLPHHGTGDNVNHAIQSQLLTIIEGCEFNGRNGRSIDTGNILFIGVGTFQMIRDLKTKEKKSLGFIAKDTEEEFEITMNDLITNGAMPEFIGRFTTAVNYRLLDRESVAIISDRYIAEFSTYMGCDIEMDEASYDLIYDMYRESPFGCRVLKSALWKILSEAGMEIERNKSASTDDPIIYLKGLKPEIGSVSMFEM